MAQFRNVSGTALYVPELRSLPVEPDEVITVPDNRYDGYAHQTATWEDVSVAPAPTPVPWTAEAVAGAPVPVTPDPAMVTPLLNVAPVSPTVETPAEVAAASNVAEPSAAQQLEQNGVAE